MQTLIFDLDGTLSDPRRGIFASINHALAGMGRPTASEASLTAHIGPPLDDTFARLLDTSDPALIRRAIELYRQRYYTRGYRQNTVYDGIVDMLDQLATAGHPMFVATAKRCDIACRTLTFLKLNRFFRDVYGCGLRRTKADLLENIVARPDVSRRQATMVGDRRFDIEAARQAGLASVGVLWGFGSREELAASGADGFAECPGQLIALVNGHRQSTVKTMEGPS